MQILEGRRRPSVLLLCGDRHRRSAKQVITYGQLQGPREEDTNDGKESESFFPAVCHAVARTCSLASDDD
jgi:hypothetical protein